MPALHNPSLIRPQAELSDSDPTHFPFILAIDLPAPPDLDVIPRPFLSPLPNDTASTLTTSESEALSSAIPEETTTETEVIIVISTSIELETTTQTRTVLEEPSTITVSVSLPPETITDTVVVTLLPFPTAPSTSASETSSFVSFSAPVTPSPTTSAIPLESSPAAHLRPLEGKEVWTMPTDLEDMDSFKVTSFPGSGKNLKIVSGIPAKASVTSNQHVSSARVTVDLGEDDDDDSGVPNSNSQVLHPLTMWSSSTTSLQLFYPEGSINPGQKPKGGEEFYASPIDIGKARNVSLRYSVYFPPDFDWVLAGKLPGLYGGHTGCSGGNAALDCFSTRLMWRTEGAGELYLYADRKKQTEALCSDPRSECNAVYGFSIGRGSFTWAKGAWTTVVQTVVLNTPGRQNGAFTLDVNGVRVIEKEGVFYRDVLWPSSGKTSTTVAKPKATTSTTSSTDPHPLRPCRPR
ncbi:hypothetical protein NMY22_g17500 [Coprinellus aureogranulatus]|nr:hypothetical protein NMY22_g17500 [Coprinellus aureogranulatus]